MTKTNKRKQVEETGRDTSTVEVFTGILRQDFKLSYSVGSLLIVSINNNSVEWIIKFLF